MGVPGFYRWVTQRYPLVRRRMNDPARPKIDYFYIDFNCIIYNALRSISMSSGGTFLQLFNEVCRYLDVLVQIAKPQIVLFISVDGPAPFAKCTQQRSRRFVAARDSAGASFNTTSISVGTTFMEDLHQHLLEYFKKKVATDRAWSTPQVIYSSHRTPGEGEHKFFNYIREVRKTTGYDPKSTHCIYSPDADLIFLALQSKENYFYIMREWEAWIGPNEGVGNGKLNKLRTGADDFELLHLPILKEYLTYDFPGIPLSNLVDDFAGFSFLIGNDFIPHFPDIIIQHGDFDQVVIAYQKSLLASKQYLVVDGKFNKPALQLFLRTVVDCLNNKSGKGEKKNQITATPNYLENARKYIAEKYPKEIKSDPEIEKKLAFSVLDSFDWVLQYYTQGCPSWTWCFDYFYAPPLIMVAEYVLEHESHFELSRPPLPFEQLLCILPPQSANLLPGSISKLMFKPSPIADYYPTSFKIDLNGRAVEHEGIVLIPFVDIHKVRELVAENLDQLSQGEKQRNTIIAASIISKSGITDFSLDIPRPARKEYPGIPPCLPLFSNPPMPMTIARTVVPVDIFNRPSNADSLLIGIDSSKYKEQPPMFISDFKDQMAILGKVILVNWPFLRPALVQMISDKSTAIRLTKSGEISSVKIPKVEYDSMIMKYRKKNALDVSNCNIMLGVRLLTISNSGETRFTFANEITYVPYELSVPINKSNTIERFASSEELPLTKNSKVVIMNGEHKNEVGIVQNISDKTATIRLINHKYPKQELEAIKQQKDSWVDYNNLLNEYGVDSDVMHKCLSNLPILGDKESNIALTIFFNGKVLEGFVNDIGKKLLISKTAYDTVREYFKRVPKLLELIQNFDESKELRNVDKEEIFNGSPSEINRQVTELMNWIKQVAPTSKSYLVDKEYMTIEQSRLEAAENALNNGTTEDEEGETVELNIADILWCGKQKCDVQQAGLFSRAISIAECGSTPFGVCGTIVGLDKKKREAFVLADSVLEFGTNMRKRLQTLRGFVQKLDDLWIY